LYGTAYQGICSFYKRCTHTSKDQHFRRREKVETLLRDNFASNLYLEIGRTARRNNRDVRGNLEPHQFWTAIYDHDRVQMRQHSNNAQALLDAYKADGTKSLYAHTSGLVGLAHTCKMTDVVRLMKTYYYSFNREVQVAMVATYGPLRKTYCLTSDTYSSYNNKIEFLRASMLAKLKSSQDELDE